MGKDDNATSALKLRATDREDLAVLSANPLTVPEEEILAIRALRTIRRGVTTYAE